MSLKKNLNKNGLSLYRLIHRSIIFVGLAIGLAIGLVGLVGDLASESAWAETCNHPNGTPHDESKTTAANNPLVRRDEGGLGQEKPPSGPATVQVPTTPEQPPQSEKDVAPKLPPSDNTTR